MGTSIDQVVCPKCGRQRLFLNTEDWRPRAIRCYSKKCGWSVDLREFWPKSRSCDSCKKRKPDCGHVAYVSEGCPDHSEVRR
jgi:hypothetical protein